VEAPGGERGNVQTGGGDRVSTISPLGCSTSLALATGPTDKEEEERNICCVNACTVAMGGVAITVDSCVALHIRITLL